MVAGFNIGAGIRLGLTFRRGRSGGGTASPVPVCYGYPVASPCGRQRAVKLWDNKDLWGIAGGRYPGMVGVRLEYEE